MVKQLHFASNLIPLILSGEKTSTWRLWDDKDLQVKDTLDFLESGTEKHFATAQIIKILEKPFKNLTDEDKRGHEKFENEVAMYTTYTKYYNKKVDKNTIVKIIQFKLI